MKLTIEELLKLAENSNKLKKNKINAVSDVHRFILAVNIKEGKKRIRKEIVYQAYKMWSAKPLLQKEFIRQFNWFFQLKNVTNYRAYALNYSAIQLLNKLDNAKIKVK